MDDRILNPLRLLIALGIVGYFAFLFALPPVEQAVQQPATPTTQPAPQPVATPGDCAAEIEQVGIGAYELRLQVSGAAERILVYTDQGNLVVSTTQAGSAGVYRVRTPGPATAVQLDDCPVLNLR
jgi:predicted aspartyl protease